MKNIVVIAHDAKKAELVQFLQERQDWTPGVNLIATGRTAEFLESQGIKCRHLSPGQSGGYIQITEMIDRGEVDIVIFLRDHKVVQQHHEDIRSLLETCNVRNIPLATNYASAELLIIGLIKKEASERMQKK
ncbi:MAG TPA: methylglyoxal synthase [Tenuifilaceae bacterium]|jgi:methylglyoxal synthase|nr:methylglyoxal synthase [Tenuifilaceae bacterium]HPX04463.1 methylglyoxal synthase [Tenuifilaceae bacterium]HQB77902.1 methylglyoxal synthase [Tenuifilaceae bacterium]